MDNTISCSSFKNSKFDSQLLLYSKPPNFENSSLPPKSINYFKREIEQKGNEMKYLIALAFSDNKYPGSFIEVNDYPDIIESTYHTKS